MSRTADQKVSILERCYSICLLGPFIFKIVRYWPLFFSLTHIIEMYSSGVCTAGSISPNSDRRAFPEVIVSLSLVSKWISGLDLGWVGCQSLNGNTVQCPVYFGLLWYSSMLIHALAYQHFCVSRLNYRMFELSRFSSSLPASVWSGGGSGVFFNACSYNYCDNHHIYCEGFKPRSLHT